MRSSLGSRTRGTLSLSYRMEQCELADEVPTDRIETRATAFPEASYRALGLDQLVVFCVDRILASGEECTFERLVCECFTLFPCKFALERYPQWPDSARVNKSWLRCRTDRKWIAGTVKTGFTMTPAGKRVAQQVSVELHQAPRGTHAPAPADRERWRAILNHIRRHSSFRTFLRDRTTFNPSIEDVRDVLVTTDDTPTRAVKGNLAYFKQVAEAYRDSDISAFLDVCGQVLELARQKCERKRC